jgi:hypothetical protein
MPVAFSLTAMSPRLAGCRAAADELLHLTLPPATGISLAGFFIKN